MDSPGQFGLDDDIDLDGSVNQYGELLHKVDALLSRVVKRSVVLCKHVNYDLKSIYAVPSTMSCH